jgi:hypothetical protein
MVVKAALRLVLMADDTVVAESEDASLWQKVLVAVNGGQAVAPLAGPQPETPGLDGDVSVVQFAEEIGVEVAQLRGACDPRTEAPYLNLDARSWEALKRNTPSRGPGAVAPMALAATMLALWFRAAKLGSPTQAQAKAVLDTLGVEDKNPSRAIKLSDWLQARPGGVIALNPAQITRAAQVARAFCLKQAPNGKKED